jgi:hypothetical protein
LAAAALTYSCVQSDATPCGAVLPVMVRPAADVWSAAPRTMSDHIGASASAGAVACMTATAATLMVVDHRMLAGVLTPPM